MEDVDGLYEKYRVFKEPEEASSHPVDVAHAYYYDGPHDYEGGILEEVEGFVFVLKPDTDRHARVALAAYAESVRVDKPHLAADLDMIMGDLNGERRE